jgi:AraC-like DNA-binding protein
MNEEISNEKIGSKLILGRLVDILFVLIIRAYLEQADIKEGFLMALKDTRISHSLKSMHESFEKNWTLQQLAATAGMSRSLYCREFKRLVGETPLSYLTNWRILKSKEILSESKENISEVANRVGYQSEAAFNRLFKAKVGETPASYRRRILN